MTILIGLLAVVVILAMAGTFYLTNGIRSRGNSLTSRTKRPPVHGTGEPQPRAPGLD